MPSPVEGSGMLYESIVVASVGRYEICRLCLL